MNNNGRLLEEELVKTIEDDIASHHKEIQRLLGSEAIKYLEDNKKKLRDAFHKLRSVDNSSTESQRPATGSREQVAERRDLNCQQTLEKQPISTEQNPAPPLINRSFDSALVLFKEKINRLEQKISSLGEEEKRLSLNINDKFALYDAFHESMRGIRRIWWKRSQSSLKNQISLYESLQKPLQALHEQLVTVTEQYKKQDPEMNYKTFQEEIQLLFTNSTCQSLVYQHCNSEYTLINELRACLVHILEAVGLTDMAYYASSETRQRYLDLTRAAREEPKDNTPGSPSSEP